jgi:hypothetical protein
MRKVKPVAGVLMLMLPVCLGCLGGNVPDIGYVEGVVTLDGQPLPNAVVTFQPQNARPSYGRTDQSGRYVLVYTKGNEGATLGKHRVAISTQSDGDPDADPPIPSSPEKVPARYSQMSQTELTADVKPGRNKVDFDLTSEGEIVQEEEEEG